MLRVNLEPRRFGTPFAVALLALALGPFAGIAAAGADPQPSPSPALMDGLEIGLSSVRGSATVGNSPPVRAMGTFVVVSVHLKNITTVAKRAELDNAFVTTPAGARYPVSTRAMIGLNVDQDQSPAEVLHEVAPGFDQSYQLAFDVPKGHRELFLHLLAAYPNVGEQRVFPLRF